MENSNNDIKTYSTEDLTRYWEGKMSPQEMHALEAAAMEDPFLADALDGYASIKSTTAAADIDELQERLLDRSQDEKVIPIKRDRKWWRIAAILIFLGGGSLVAYMVMQQNTNNQLAKTETPAAKAEEKANDITKDSAPDLRVDTLTVVGGTLPVIDTTQIAWQQIKSNDLVSNYSTNEPSAKGADVSVRVPDLSQYKTKDTNTDSDMALEGLARQQKETADSLLIVSNEARSSADRLQRRVSGIQTPQSNAPAARAENDRPVYNFYSGRVVDQRNNAIPYASVGLNNRSYNATANAEGYFQLKSPDSVLNLNITSAGYETRNVTLRGNDPVQNVTLDPLPKGKLEEVVVTSKSARKTEQIHDKDIAKKSASSKPSDLKVYVMDAQPVNGWDEYNEYLAENNRADDESVKGEVVVTFWVNKKGKLSDFTVEKSLGKAQDDEAIRLIKEGPDWKLLKGKKTRARVIVAF